MPQAAKKFFQTPERPAANKRGYDKEWNILREAFAREHKWCIWCLRNGKKSPVAIVDHVRPIKGKDDINRLRWSNLQPLCRSCHAKKTNEDRRC